mmetsp:Transcript_8611/g.20632  ORF Transcript_8611/g.20632 Transcript_8611/m.20632 type:complete len:242 (-) Transcript_8611:89-814(-)
MLVHTSTQRLQLAAVVRLQLLHTLAEDRHFLLCRVQLPRQRPLAEHLELHLRVLQLTYAFADHPFEIDELLRQYRRHRRSLAVVRRLLQIGQQPPAHRFEPLAGDGIALAGVVFDRGRGSVADPIPGRRIGVIVNTGHEPLDYLDPLNHLIDAEKVRHVVRQAAHVVIVDEAPQERLERALSRILCSSPRRKECLARETAGAAVQLMKLCKVGEAMPAFEARAVRAAGDNAVLRVAHGVVV